MWDIEDRTSDMEDMTIWNMTAVNICRTFDMRDIKVEQNYKRYQS